MKISEIEFKKRKIDIYFDNSEISIDKCVIIWQARNPDSFYVGPMYMDTKTGKITYPENAIIPIQTDEDKEILPKCIVIDKKELTTEDLEIINKILEKEYELRNNKNMKKHEKTF